MTEGMEWESPPPASAYDWYEVARTLRANPGQWLKVFDDGPVSVVNAIRQSTVSPLTPLAHGGQAGFEVTTRNNVVGPPRTATLYLRWINEEDEDAT